MKLQGSDARSIKTLQFQNSSHRQMRYRLSHLAVLHGQRLTFQITHATDSDTNAERDQIIGELRKNRSIEAEQVYQAGQNLSTERVNRYITDGEIMLAKLVVNGD